MKKWMIGAAILVAIAGGYVAAAHFSGGAIPSLGIPVGGDRAELRDKTLSFWEDIEFKDFDQAASYHAPDTRNDVDIPFLLERVFLLKPEVLEILSYEIVFAEIDSTGLRARVKTRVKVRNLMKDDVFEREVLLFWHRDTLESPWFMVLESSLRMLEGTKGKKH